VLNRALSIASSAATSASPALNCAVDQTRRRRTHRPRTRHQLPSRTPPSAAPPTCLSDKTGPNAPPHQPRIPATTHAGSPIPSPAISHPSVADIEHAGSANGQARNPTDRLIGSLYLKESSHSFPVSFGRRFEFRCGVPPCGLEGGSDSGGSNCRWLFGLS
jgi:hypothetical protein